MAILFNGFAITFAEVPDEVSLTFAITNCQGNCEGCHSPHLRENKGTDLLQVLPELLKKYNGMISCVCFLGEGNDVKALEAAIHIVKSFGLKVCVYSGRDDFMILGEPQFRDCDYVKIGSYKQALGGLSERTTNQRMYKHEPTRYWESRECYVDWVDITNKFWQNTLPRQ